MGNKRVIAAPSVRKRAHALSIQLDQITGSGKNGRILMDDISVALASTSQPKSKMSIKEKGQSNPYQEIPFQGIRKQKAEKRMDAVNQIPHVTHYDEIDLTRLLELIQNIQVDDKKVLLDAFFCKVLANTMIEFPVFNAVLDEQEAVIHLHEQVNISFEFDTHFSVLESVQTKTYHTLYSELKLARTGQVQQKHDQKSTCTLQRSGGIRSTPIIHYPQTSTIVFHKLRQTPVFTEEGAYEIRSLINISFSFDHRVADGTDAVKCTNRLKGLIEQPELLLFTC